MKHNESEKLLKSTELNQTKLKDILTQQDITKSINDNLPFLLSIIPEIKNMIGFPHNHPHHHLDVWNHTLLALEQSNNDFEIRLTLLLHDIGKPFSYQDEEVRHFHGHAKVSSEMSKVILKRLGYSEEFITRISTLIELHDTKITEEDINNNLELTLLRLHIQECDSKAHNPDYVPKRLQYIEETRKLIKRQK